MAANPPIVPADTSTAVWRAQMAAIRGRSVSERLAEWEALNRSVREMAAAAVRRQHPDYDERQVFLALVRRWHGDELALKVWPDAASVAP